MLKKKIGHALLAFVATLVLVGCASGKSTDYMTWSVNFESGNGVSHKVFKYDFGSKEPKLVYELEPKNMLSVNTYAGDQNAIYFSDNVTEDLASEQAIYKLDVKSKKAEAVVEGLTFVEKIIYTEKGLYIVTANANVGNSILKFYNFESKELSDINLGETFTVVDAYYDAIGKQIAIAKIDYVKDAENNPDENQPYVNPEVVVSLLKTDDNKVEDLFTTKPLSYNYMVIKDGNVELNGNIPGQAKSESEVYTYSLESKEATNETRTNDVIGKDANGSDIIASSAIGLTADAKSYYVRTNNQFIVYNVESKEYEAFYRPDSNFDVISNAIIYISAK